MAMCERCYNLACINTLKNIKVNGDSGQRGAKIFLIRAKKGNLLPAIHSVVKSASNSISRNLYISYIPLNTDFRLPLFSEIDLCNPELPLIQCSKCDKIKLLKTRMVFPVPSQTH